MYRLFSLSALLISVVGADPRSPKIYNVLISTKKNLSPSHALPVYEPVLRTTSLGIALPSFLYPTPIATFQPNFITKEKPGKPENEEDGSLQPLPIEQFIPYTYTPHILTPQGFYTPVNQPTEEKSTPKILPNTDELYQKSADPKAVIANLKRNPNIPDVPPPALPTRNTS